MKLEGLNELQNILKSIVPKYNDSIVVLERVGNPLVSRLKANAPIRTGALSRSFQIYKSKKRTAIVIGPKYGKGDSAGNHINLVEYGYTMRDGTFKEGRPFVRKTYDSMAKTIESNLSSEFKKLIENNFNK